MTSFETSVYGSLACCDACKRHLAGPLRSVDRILDWPWLGLGRLQSAVQNCCQNNLSPRRQIFQFFPHLIPDGPQTKVARSWLYFGNDANRSLECSDRGLCCRIEVLPSAGVCS